MSKITSQILAQVAPGTPKGKRDRFLADFNSVLPRYGITSELRVAAFLTTVCFESDYFKALAEYASGWAYDISKNKRKAIELGNTEVGDGPKYKGAGGIETTGKKNYQRLSDRLGVDFVAHPELLRTVKYFVEAACVFWDDNKFNRLADKGKIVAIQNLTNRGSADKPAKALASRVKIYQNVLHILPDDFELTNSAAVPVSDTRESPAEIAGIDTPSAVDAGTLTPPQSQPTSTETVATETKVETPEGSITEKVIAKAESVGDKFQSFQSVLDKFGFAVEDAKRSVWTVVMTFGKLLFAAILALWGMFREHPEIFIPAAIALAALAYFLWDRSGKRLAEAKAGVPVSLAKEIIAGGSDVAN